MGNTPVITDETKNLVKKSYRPIPVDFFERPVLLLDSGQSVAESVFLEKFREYIYKLLAKYSTKGNRPSVWLLYPDKRHWARHGAFDVSGFEEWEVRPVRRMRELEGGGFMSTVAAFEDGCHHLKIDAPWRTYNSKRRRAVGVYLNPTERDIKWIKRNHKAFQKDYNLPKLHIGQPANRSLPYGVTQWTDLVWCYDREARDRLAQAFEPYFVKRIPWEQFWLNEKNPEHEAVAAPDWRDMNVIRLPHVAENFGKALGLGVYMPKNNGTWEDFLLGTSCSKYILATTRERVPFDALVALSRGATLVAPDVPLFQRLHGKKILYPAKMVGERIVWSQSEVEHYLKGITHGLDNN